MRTCSVTSCNRSWGTLQQVRQLQQASHLHRVLQQSSYDLYAQAEYMEPEVHFPLPFLATGEHSGSLQPLLVHFVCLYFMKCSTVLMMKQHSLALNFQSSPVLKHLPCCCQSVAMPYLRDLHCTIICDPSICMQTLFQSQELLP